MSHTNPPTSPTPPSIDTLLDNFHKILRLNYGEIHKAVKAGTDDFPKTDAQLLTLFESIMLEVIGEDGKYTNPLSETGFLQGRDDMKTYYQNELRAEQRTKAAAALERLRNGQTT